MKTLMDRLKPEVKTLLEKEKEIYPHTVEDIYDHLKITYYVMDVTYGTIIHLQGIDGLADTSPFDMFLKS